MNTGRPEMNTGRPETNLEGQVTIQEMGRQMADGIFRCASDTASSGNSLTTNLQVAEQAAITLIGLMAMNIIMQKRGERAAYLKWVREAIEHEVDFCLNQDLELREPGGVVISSDNETIN